MSRTILLFLFIFVSSVNSDNYATIIMERIEVVYFDEEYGKIQELSVKKINRTTFAINGEMDFYKDWHPDVMVEIKTFAMYSNEYRPVPLVIKRNICSAYKFEYNFIKEEIEKTDNNVPNTCPVKKGHYYIKNMIPTTNNIPVGIPWKKMLVQIKLIDEKQKVFADFKFYATFDHDAKYRKNG